MQVAPRALIVAGTHSGVGKTTVSLALVAALRARGVRVGACKIGPDFIDAAHLAAATGAECWNLDGWMLGRDAARRGLAAAAAGCDFVLVEGMMGVFDGLGGGEAGSSAEMAKWLGLPVLLVADAVAGIRSVAATVLGFRDFDPELRLAGAICNRTGGAGHAAMLREAMSAVAGVALLGCAPATPDLGIPERHLGLTMPTELASPLEAARLADWAEINLDVDACLRVAAEWEPIIEVAPEMPAPPLARQRWGLARDAAFCFYYPENLARLSAAGIEWIEFSPLSDAALPASVSGLYFGGGYPELHAGTLAANHGMLAAVRRFADAGGFIYAECGGLMYLARTLTDVGGVTHPLAGVLPCSVAMQSGLAAIGYREVRPVGLASAHPMLARGHEFHHSRLSWVASGVPSAHQARSPAGSGEWRDEGIAMGNVFASYIHLHFGSCPELAPALAQRAAAHIPEE